MHLQVNNLGYRRGDTWLLRGLDLQVAQGQVVWLRGDNGRGKTTLLRLLAKLTMPDEGSVTLTDAAPAPVYLAHANALNGDLSAEEALQFMAQLHGQPCEGQRVAQALRALDVFRCRRQLVRTLSQGQRRRVALARLALETPPGLWLLDEPFDALDTSGVNIVNGLLKTHTARGGCAVLTSHISVQCPDVEVRPWTLEPVGSV